VKGRPSSFRRPLIIALASDIDGWASKGPLPGLTTTTQNIIHSVKPHARGNIATSTFPVFPAFHARFAIDSFATSTGKQISFPSAFTAPAALAQRSG